MMYRKLPLFVLVALVGLTGLASGQASAGEHYLGGGLEFWRTVDGLPDSDTFDDIDDDGSSWVLSYQYRPRGLFRFELNLEYFEDGFAGSDEAAIAPQAFLLIGRGLYGGIGIGQTFSDGLEDEVSDPFFMGRLGFEFALLGPLSLDIHATYRFDDWDELEGIDFDSDTYTFGAYVRFRI